MDKFAGTFRGITLVLFTLILVYTYALLPDAVVWNVSANAFETISKENFFFIALGLGFGINLIFVGAGRYFKKRSYLVSPQIPFNLKAMPGWIYGFAGFLNLFFIFLLFFFGFINSGEDLQSNNFYGPLFYLGPVLIVAWLLYLPLALRKKNEA
jgi:hypothetical protein